MNATPPRRLAVLAAAACLSAGCFKPSREFNTLQHDVLATLDIGVKEQQSFGLGRFSMGMLRGLVRTAGDDPDADLAARLMGAVREVEVGCCQLESTLDDSRLDTLLQIDDAMINAGLEPMVRHAEPGEVVTIYVQIKRDRVRQMCVVTLDDSELVLLRLRGRLDDAVALALATGCEGAPPE